MIILETPRLILRTLQEEDAKRMVEYRNKEEVSKYQSWDHYSYDEAIERINHCLTITDYSKSRIDYHLAIETKDHQMIGDLFVENMTKKIMMLGYTLDSDYWSNGYAQEIVNAFIDYMKETYHFKKVMCYVYPENERSIHLLIKCGFKKFDESYFYHDQGYIKNL